MQTPVADDAIDRVDGKFNSRGEPKLSAQVKRMPSIRKTDADRGGRGDLIQAVRGNSNKHFGRMPTPLKTDADKWNNQSLAERLAKRHQVRLGNAAMPEGGSGGSLNPPWVEWLMGWPIGWTALQRLEMGKFRKWLRSHGVY